MAKGKWKSPLRRLFVYEKERGQLAVFYVPYGCGGKKAMGVLIHDPGEKDDADLDEGLLTRWIKSRERLTGPTAERLVRRCEDGELVPVWGIKEKVRYQAAQREAHKHPQYRELVNKWIGRSRGVLTADDYKVLDAFHVRYGITHAHHEGMMRERVGEVSRQRRKMRQEAEMEYLRAKVKDEHQRSKDARQARKEALLRINGVQQEMF